MNNRVVFEIMLDGEPITLDVDAHIYIRVLGAFDYRADYQGKFIGVKSGPLGGEPALYFVSDSEYRTEIGIPLKDISILEVIDD